MMTNDVGILARRWFEQLWNERRVEAFAEMVAPDAVMLSNSAGELRSAEEFRTRIFEPFMAAFPDLHVDVVGTVVDGDEVAVRWTAAATHIGGRSIFIRGMTWLCFRQGQIIAGWDCWNRSELMEALSAS
jgi:steroid delta-isomerase-like uncharacterized protein